MQTTTINNREFQITEELTSKYAFMSNNLKQRGFDGTIWQAFSPRRRNQRNDLHSLLTRSATTGDYVIITSVA